MANKVWKTRLVSPEPAIFVFYAAVTAIMTYPAATLISRTYAEPRDPLGTIWWFWWYKYSYAHHMPVQHAIIAGVPSGIKITPFALDPLYFIVTRTLSLISTEIVAYNIFLLLSFFLAAVAMYFLVRNLTRSRAAATVAGLAFGFCPYVLAHGKEHLGLTAIFWLPVFTLLLVKAWRKRTGWSIAGCGAILVVLTLFNYQYGFLATVFGTSLLISIWLAGAPWRRISINWGILLKAIATIVVVAGIGAALLVALKHSTSGSARPIEALYQFSARPWDYILPSPEAAFFGGLTSNFVNSHLHDGFLVENSLFLGYTTIILATYALVATFRKHRRKPVLSDIQSINEDDVLSREPSITHVPGNRKLVLAFAASGAIAFLFSMPPTAKVLGINLYFPSDLLYRALPQFRAYARFGIVVMMCTVVLAGFGIAILMEHFTTRGSVIAVTAALLALLIIEFTIVPPFHSLDSSSTTDYYRFLKRQPGDSVVAIYPFYILDDFYNYGYLFAQRFHKKKMVNGAQPDTYAASYRESMLDIKHPATPGLLKKAGVKYVIVIPKHYTEGVVHPNYVYATVLDDRAMPPGLRKVKSFPDATIYEVTEAAASFVCLYESGAYEPYVDIQGRSWHPCTGTTSVEFHSYLDKPATCSIRLQVMSASKTRRVGFSVNGEVESVVAVPPSPVDVVLEDVVLSPGVNTLKIESDGSPVYLSEVTDYSQVRACIMTSDITVERNR